MFLIFGIGMILDNLFKMSFIQYITIGLIALDFGLGIVIFFKTPKDDVIVINADVMNKSKIALYGIALGLLIRLLLVFEKFIDYFVIGSGSLMIISAFYGLYHLYKAIKNS